jgi:hypothetical protein
MMGRLRLITTLAGFPAAAALCFSPAPATGDGGEKTKIVIKRLAPTGASGKVISKDNACEGGRKVSLFRLDDFLSVKLEITQSKPNGTWKTGKDLQDGRYFAKVDSSPGCRYAVSPYKNLG